MDPKTNKTGSIKGIIIVFIITISTIMMLGTAVGTQSGLIQPSELLQENDDASLFNSVPNDANIVMRMDAEGLAKDNTTEMIAENTSDEILYENKSITKQLVKKPVESVNQTNFNVDIEEDDIDEIIMFSNFGIGKSIVGSTYSGTVINIQNITAEEIAEVIHGPSIEYNKTEYSNFEVIRINSKSKSVAKLNDQLYVFGDSIAVNKSIDTIRGDTEPINDSRIPDVEGQTYLSVNAQNLTTVFGEINTGKLTGHKIPNNITMSYSTDNDNNITIDIEADDGTENISKIGDKLEFGSNITGVEETSVNFSTSGIDATYKTNPENFEKTYKNITSLYGTDVDSPYSALEDFEKSLNE